MRKQKTAFKAFFYIFLVGRPCPVVLFILLCKVVLTFDSVYDSQKSNHSNEMEAMKQFFPLALFIILYKVLLTFESMHEILQGNR